MRQVDVRLSQVNEILKTRIETMKKAIIETKKFVLFLTGSEERILFDEVYDFELAKKQEEESGNGFRCWIEVAHNDELLIIGLD